MNILIADDEHLVRLGLIHMLNELYPEQLTFAQARNGMELLEIAEEFLPDLIFVDIKMPLLDGLSAMTQLREHGYQGHFLILSGFSEFAYAKDALKLGAVDYLLKPVGTEQLHEAMEHALEQLRLSYHHQNSLFSLQLLQMLSCQNFSNFPDANSSFEQISSCTSSLPEHHTLSCYACVFFLDLWEKQARAAVLSHLSQWITQYAGRHLDLHLYYSLFSAPNGDPAFLFQNSDQSQKILDALSAFLTNLDAPISSFFFYGTSMHQTLSQIAVAQEFSAMRILFPRRKLLSLENIRASCKETDNLLHFCQTLESLCFSCIEKNRPKCLRLLKELSQPSYALFFSDKFLGHMNSYVFSVLPFSPKAHDRETFLASFSSFLSSDFFAQREKPSSSIVPLIQRYLEEHYHEDLSIDSVASLFDLSPNYLSRIFHEQTSCKFTQYLTTLRIEQAANLLKNRPTMPIKAIAEAVGYYSPRYFSKVFYEFTGSLPSEYRSKNN